MSTSESIASENIDAVIKISDNQYSKIEKWCKNNNVGILEKLPFNCIKLIYDCGVEIIICDVNENNEVDNCVFLFEKLNKVFAYGTIKICKDEYIVSLNFIDTSCKPSQDMVYQFCLYASTISMSILSYLFYHKNNLELLPQKEMRLNTNHHKSKTKKSASNKINTYKVFTFSNIVPKKEKLHHEINCECWCVRGHYRHYSSGNVVFIKSYKKGKNKDNFLYTAKEYKLIKEG